MDIETETITNYTICTQTFPCEQIPLVSATKLSCIKLIPIMSELQVPVYVSAMQRRAPCTTNKILSLTVPD